MKNAIKDAHNPIRKFTKIFDSLRPYHYGIIGKDWAFPDRVRGASAPLYF